MESSFVAELIDAFVQDGRQLLATLRQGLAEENLETFRRAAHSLKSNSESLGATSLAALARELEIMARGRSLEGAGERMAPLANEYESTIELLNSYYTLMFDAIGGHGGIVNQMLGDGLMAIFGAPLPRSDHRDRAVRAALEMLELVDLFNHEQRLRGGPAIHIGIGIASGSVVAGLTGTEQRATYTCVGDTVNLAAHLEAHTKVVGRPILIDESTRGGLGAGIVTESHGHARFKTSSRAVEVYSVLSSRRT
jgi:class 3 adenylate cyclase